MGNNSSLVNSCKIYSTPFFYCQLLHDVWCTIVLFFSSSKICVGPSFRYQLLHPFVVNPFKDFGTSFFYYQLLQDLWWTIFLLSALLGYVAFPTETFTTIKQITYIRRLSVHIFIWNIEHLYVTLERIILYINILTSSSHTASTDVLFLSLTIQTYHPSVPAGLLTASCFCTELW